MLILAVAETLLSIAEVAVRLTCEAYAVVPDGAMYRIESPLAVWSGEKLPQSTVEQSVPGTDIVQLTPAFAGSFVTVATKLCPLPSSIVVVGGSMEIEMDPVMVTIADAVFVPSATEVAVSVTLSGRSLIGAVYVVEAPLAVEAGETDPHDDVEQDTFHFTP